MSAITLAYIAVIAGFIGLIWSADKFVAGSAAIAKNLGVSKLMIGLTIVAFGTSAPEVLVSIISSLENIRATKFEQYNENWNINKGV